MERALRINFIIALQGPNIPLKLFLPTFFDSSDHILSDKLVVGVGQSVHWAPALAFTWGQHLWGMIDVTQFGWVLEFAMRFNFVQRWRHSVKGYVLIRKFRDYCFAVCMFGNWIFKFFPRFSPEQDAAPLWWRVRLRILVALGWLPVVNTMVPRIRVYLVQ